MNTSSWKDIVELVGIAAIVGSLIFVGLQMKQSQQIALSAIYQARADSSMAIRFAPLESEALLSATAKRLHGEADPLSPRELAAEAALISGNTIYLENVHYQYLNGFITEEHWETNREEMKSLMRRAPDFRQYVISSCSFHRESFCAELRRAIEAVDLESQ